MIAALGGQNGGNSTSPPPATVGASSRRLESLQEPPGDQRHESLVGYLDCHQPTYSPLEILAAAVATSRHTSLTGEASSSGLRQGAPSLTAPGSLALQATENSTETLAADKAVELYFSQLAFNQRHRDSFAYQITTAPRTQEQTDWQILVSQPADSTLQLQSTLHDPINSRLVDSEDAILYFNL